MSPKSPETEPSQKEPPPANAPGRVPASRIGLTSLAASGLLFLATPPLGFWPAALVAVIPYLMLVEFSSPLSRRDYVAIWAAAAIYWLVALEGLRHAHVAMYACWIALSFYLAVYPVIFVAITARLRRHGWSLWLAGPIVWVATELVRNHFITGISAAMLGHTMADVPTMIQIADLAGSYGIGFVIVSINVAVFSSIRVLRRLDPWQSMVAPVASAVVLLAATLVYGTIRLSHPIGPTMATFTLLQLDEPVEYEQAVEREVEIFQSYARHAIEITRRRGEVTDVIVFPESMFTGGSPWMTAADDAVIPAEASITLDEFLASIQERQAYFRQRAGYVQALVTAEANSSAGTDQVAKPPTIIGGCGVVHYADKPMVYSGVVQIGPDGDLVDWYGKTHLVMFGEYVPIAPWIPGLRNLIPPGMGLQTGDGAKIMRVGDTKIAPNICIETAVERVTVNQMADLRSKVSDTRESNRDDVGSDAGIADVVVTVTNDGWFDDSAVIDHHLRCAQLVAVGIRRPILSAANNGPTAWIDSSGRIIDRVPTGTAGEVIASPTRDDRTSLYVRIGDWPAWACLVAVIVGCVRGRKIGSRKVGPE